MVPTNIVAKKSELKSKTFKQKKIITIEDIGAYNKFINLVNGEFDLYLKKGKGYLKVYFPNGCFSIVKFVNNDGIQFIEIKIEEKSKKASEVLMDKLMGIYSHARIFCGLKEFNYELL